MPTFKAIVLFVATVASAASADDFVVIRNAQGAPESVKKGDLKAAYTGKLKQWPSGNLVQVVLSQDSNPASAWFADAVCGVSAKNLSSKIKQEVFKGEMAPPLMAGTDAEAIENVKSHPGSVAVVSAAAAASLPAGVAVTKVE